MTAVQTPSTSRAAAAVAGDDGRTREKVSLATLTRVEVRKLADTRSGLWLLIAIGLAAAATAVILLTAGSDEEQTFEGLLTFGLLPSSVLLPVLGILSMTSEFSQRTALTTFTLTPARGRVIAAKLLAAGLIAVTAAVAAAALSAVANLIAIGTGGDGSWHLATDQAARLVLSQIIYVLMGSAFGALLMNSPLAIVLYFAIPTAWSVLGQLVGWLGDAAKWLDLNVTSIPLMDSATMSGGEWARLGASCALWVVLPLVLGTIRVLRREVS